MSESETLPTDWTISERSGLPEVLRVLLSEYPRDIWRKHENMGSLMRFWLARHDNFRRAAEMLNARNNDFLEGTIEPEQFAAEMGPGFNAFLGGLTEHHTIEDRHYFPKFQQIDARLKRGFELLDKDHHALHDAMAAVATTANVFISDENVEDRLKNGEIFVKANQKLLAFLKRHLEDEEDIIVPITLAHGEQIIEQ